jgi:hypothetical protein
MTLAVDKTTDTALTANDYLVGDEDAHPNLLEFKGLWALGVSAHLYAETPLVVRLYERDNRVTVRVGGDSAELYLYLPADQIDRLITLLTAARKRLPSA